MTKPNWFKRCETEWKRIVRNGKKGYDCHHVLPKSVYPHFRFTPENGIYISRIDHSWAEDNPVKFLGWLEEFHPKKYKWYLANKDDRAYRDLDYEEIYNELKGK